MARIIEIEDLREPALRPYAGLTNAQLRSRRDESAALIIAESPRVIACALDAGCRPVSLLAARRHLSGTAGELIERCGDIPVYTAPEEVLSSLTGYSLTRGVLCALRRPAPESAETVCRAARRVAVLENIADATNIGAIFRSAAALGMDAVLLTPRCADPFSRRAARVSMGTVFQIPWARLGERDADWPERGMARLRAMGFATAALALRPDAVGVDDPALRRAERLAVLLGAEGDGLAAETIAACDFTVRIPMSHGVDSLNVAAAGAVAFWELRER